MKKGAYILSELDTKRNKTRVTFLAYRDWALKAISIIASKCEIEVVDIIQTEDEYKKKVLSYSDNYVDYIILLGWSWIIKDDTLQKFLVIGMHPSDLPLYRGGSPIQHQIINGLEKTNISLMTISPNGVDVGDIWLKEEWDLSSSTMSKILENLAISTSKLLCRFFNTTEKIIPQHQDLSKGSYYQRRKPSDSQVSWDILSKMKLRDIYNLIRALGDPYPNIYIEDDDGNRLLFKEVVYIPRKERKV